MKKFFFIPLLVLILSGCATQGVSSFDYTKKTPIEVKNELQLNQPYLQVWDKLIKELSKSFYIINNIDKESRIINLSFSSSKPSDFVECGSTSRTYKQGEHIESITYDVADNSTFRVATQKQEHPTMTNYFSVRRVTNLEGRTNIYLAPLDSDKTKTLITVNTRYVLNINTFSQGYAQHISGNLFTRGNEINTPNSVSFNTNKPNSAPTDQITCFSKGKLEQDVLQLLN
ncbi:MAG: membrane lipoprotein lipid attachment site-containing protein [Undibacterium sp.]|uniref:membrane lipoprotein lipid attachment site-containing protein n=1 Tax=Undibacterium sp. TaxID=1914977 RepID=UPI002722449E|nr:membrane lipoprotein lipid attachment site-containing protein [Undibacterium sp.]MDO8652026.1 membrane lipoprotein lipid attachment site-containing protein [Undibacterium sp.]